MTSRDPLAPLFSRVRCEIGRMRLGLSDDERDELVSRTFLVLVTKLKKGAMPFSAMPRNLPGYGWPPTENEELGDARDHGYAVDLDAWIVVLMRYSRGIARKLALKIRGERCDQLPEDDRLEDRSGRDEDALISTIDARRDLRASLWLLFQARVVKPDPRDGEPARSLRARVAVARCPRDFIAPAVITPETVERSFRDAWQRLRAREAKRTRRSVRVRAPLFRMAS